MAEQAMASMTTRRKQAEKVGGNGFISPEELILRTAESQSLAHLLMTMGYRPEDRVFRRVDGWVFTATEVDPAASIDRSNDMLALAQEAVARGIGSLQPDGAIIQVFVVKTKDVSSVCDEYEQLNTAGIPLIDQIRPARAKFVRDGAHNPLLVFPGTDRQFASNRLRVIICIMIPPLQKITAADGAADFLLGLLPGSVRSALGGDRRDPCLARFEEQYQAQARICIEQTNQVMGKLAAVGCVVRPIDDIRYISIMREILYPVSGHRYPVTGDDAHLPIDMRVPVMPYDWHAPSRTLGCPADQTYMAVATLHEGLKQTWPGIISLPNSLIQASILDFLDYGYIAISAQAERRRTVENRLQDQLDRIRGGMAMPGMAAKAEEDRVRAQRYCSGDGRRLFQAELTICCHGSTPDEARARLGVLRERMNDVLGKMREETYAAPTFFFRSLPGNAFPPIDGAYRHQPMWDRQIADLLPIYHRSTGMREPLMLLHNVTGAPFSLSLWGGSSQHTIVVGRTGTGKSFFVGNLLLDALAVAGTVVIIIDKGKSYKPLTMLLGDSALYLNAARGGLTINPLYGTQQQAGQFGSAFITQLCLRPGGTPLTEAQLGLLERVIRKVFEDRMIRTTFNTIEELRARYPDTIIGEATKALPCRYVSPEVRKKILHATEDSDIHLYYRYQVISLTTEKDETVQVRSMEDIPGDLQRWLASDHYLLDVTDGRVAILHQEAGREEDLRAHRILARSDTSQCTIILSRIEDVLELESAKVVFILSDDIVARRRSEIEAELMADAEWSATTAEIRGAEVARRLANIGGRDLYLCTEGTAVVQREVFLSDVGRELEILSVDTPAAADLVDRLSPYYGEGALRSYFDGRTSISFANLRLVDIELATFADNNDPHLVSCVLASLIQSINIFAATVKPTKDRCIVAMDEAWQLMGPGGSGKNVVGEAIAGLFRLGRKSSLACMVISQSITDFFVNEAARGILQNSPNRFILRQPDSAIDEIGKALGYSPERVELLRSLRTESGHYSQILIDAGEQSPPIFDAAMFITNPHQYWIMTTKPSDRDARDQMVLEVRKRNPEMTEEAALPYAIDLCAQRWPKGYKD